MDYGNNKLIDGVLQFNTAYRRREICDLLDTISWDVRCEYMVFFFLYLFNTVPLHSLKYNSQRLNRRNRGLVLVTSWSKELFRSKSVEMK